MSKRQIVVSICGFTIICKSSLTRNENIYKTLSCYFVHAKLLSFANYRKKHVECFVLWSVQSMRYRLTVEKRIWSSLYVFVFSSCCVFWVTVAVFAMQFSWTEIWENEGFLFVLLSNFDMLGSICSRVPNTILLNAEDY